MSLTWRQSVPITRSVGPCHSARIRRPPLSCSAVSGPSTFPLPARRGNPAPSHRRLAALRLAAAVGCFVALVTSPAVSSAKPFPPKAASFPPVATVGKPYSFQFTFVDANNPGTACPAPMLVTPLSPPPPGLQLTSQGLLQGTPTVAGTFSFQFTAKGPDPNGPCGTPTIDDATLTVTAALALAPASLPGGVVGTPYSQQLTASGGSGSFVFTLSGALPPGLSLRPSGLLSGTPTTRGGSTFTVIATDARNNVIRQAYSLAVFPPATQVASDLVLPQTLAGAAAATQQLGNIQQLLDHLRITRNPTVTQGLKVSIDGQALPPLAALGLAPGADRGTSAAQTGGGAAADSEILERWGVFAQGEIDIAETDPTASQPGIDLTTHGLTLGADYRPTNGSVVGVALGLVKSTADLSSGAANQDTKGWSVSAFGEIDPVENGYVNLTITYGQNKYDSVRRANASLQPPTTFEYTGAPRGSQFGAALAAGYQYYVQALTLNPYGRVDYLDIQVDAFQEDPANGASNPLTVSEQRFKSTVLTLGGQAQYAYSTAWGVLVPYVRAEYQYVAQSSTKEVAVSYAGGILQPVALAGTDRNYGHFAVGASAVLPHGLSGYFNYEQLIGKQNYSDSRYMLGLRYAF
jgi:outer membrane autotransporter protein